MLHKEQLELMLTEWALIGSKENYDMIYLLTAIGLLPGCSRSELEERLTENDLLVL